MPRNAAPTLPLQMDTRKKRMSWQAEQPNGSPERSGARERKPSSKHSPEAASLAVKKTFEPLGADEVLEVQKHRCHNGRYQHLPRCRACLTSSVTEPCRFRSMRHIACKDGVALRPLGTFEQGPGYRLGSPQGGVGAQERSQAQLVLRHLAAPFERLVEEELALTRGEVVTVVTAKAKGAGVVAAGAPPTQAWDGDGERQTCDWCSTTIWHRYRMCAQCGYEVCLHCAEAWRKEGARPEPVMQARAAAPCARRCT